MALKECEKCGEMVGEAKAFCPACGHAFVDEETRREKSKFDSLENTVQLGQTMFGNMLSDMGLNISKAPNAPEKRIEVIAPAAEATEPVKKKPDNAKPPKTVGTDSEVKPSSRNRWYGIAGALVILIWLLILIAGFVMFVYMPRSGNF